MNRWALARREKALDVDHPDRLRSVYYLSHLLKVTQDHHEAVNIYQRTIVGLNKILGPEHPITVACQRYRASHDKNKETLRMTLASALTPFCLA